MLSDWETSTILNSHVPNPHSDPASGGMQHMHANYHYPPSPSLNAPSSALNDLSAAIIETMASPATINNPALSATLHTQLGNLLKLESEVQQNKRQWLLRMNNIRVSGVGRRCRLQQAPKAAHAIVTTPNLPSLPPSLPPSPPPSTQHDLSQSGVYNDPSAQVTHPVFSPTKSPFPVQVPRTPGQVSYLSPSQYPSSKQDSMNDLTTTMIKAQSDQVAQLVQSQQQMKEDLEDKISQLEDLANCTLEAVQATNHHNNKRTSHSSAGGSPGGHRRRLSSGSATLTPLRNGTSATKKHSPLKVPHLSPDGHHSGHHGGYSDNDRPNHSTSHHNSHSNVDTSSSSEDEMSSMRHRRKEPHKNMADKIAKLHAKDKKKKKLKKTKKKITNGNNAKATKNGTPSPGGGGRSSLNAKLQFSQRLSLSDKVDHSKDREKYKPEENKLHKKEFVPAGTSSFAWVGRTLKAYQL